MQSLRNWLKGLSAAVCLCGTLVLAQEAPKDPANAAPTPPVPARIIVALPGPVDDPNNAIRTVEVFPGNQSPGAGGALFVYADPGSAQAEPGKYWVGLICVDAGETLREQLGLDANVGLGLVVDSVSEDSPAKKAGVQKNDVLLSATYPVDDAKGETKPLNQVGDLIAAVQKAETKSLKLLLLRKGQKQILEVTPAERPQAPVAVQVRSFGPAEQQLQAILEAQRKQADAQGIQPPRAVSALRMAGPMFVPQPQHAPKLPDGMTVEFRQVVGQPERILVSKGDQKWEANTDDLSKLPADVRGAVEHQIAFRRGMIMGPGMMGYTNLQPFPGGGVGFSPNPPATVAAPATVQVHSRATSTRLPDDLSVSVTKKGSEPARITVKKGDQTWEITDKELDKLPPDVRKHVETAINPGYGARAVATWATRSPNEQYTRTSPWKEVLGSDSQPRPAFGVPASPNQQLQERQEAMLKQLQALTEKVEKLQQALEKSTPKQ